MPPGANVSKGSSIVILLALVAKLALGGLPPGWKVVAQPFPLPTDLQPWMSGYCKVDSTGRFFYTRDHQIDVRTGRSREYGVFMAFREPGRVQEFQLCWMDQAPKGWELSGFRYIFYAKGETLGGMIPESSIGGLRRGGTLFSAIGGGPHQYDEGLLPFLQSGVAWKVPYYGIPHSEMFAGSGPAILCGNPPVRVPLPKSAEFAVPLPNGILWDKKVAYVIWQGKWSVMDFHGKHVTYRGLTSDGWVAKGAPTEVPNVLVDGTICVTLNASNIKVRPKGMTSDIGTEIWVPSKRRWSYFDGILLWGTSHDGRFVAFSMYPEKQIRIATVGAN